MANSLTTDDAASKSINVYKILPSSAWSDALEKGFFLGSADDLRDGFIHLSSASQVDGTLRKYFRHQANLLIIAFDAADLASLLKWETSRGGDLFPHYYGPLPVALAQWQKPLSLGSDGTPLFLKDVL